MDAIKNITIGHTERLYKPVGYTMLANLVNIIPFASPSRRCASSSPHSTAVDDRSTRQGCGAFSAYWPSICWRCSGRAGLLPGQFQRGLRNERIGAYRTGGTPAEALVRISFPARPRRSFVHARYRFHNGRDGHFPPFAPIDGSRRHARAGVPLAGVDRLADGHCHVRRTAGRPACPMDEHEVCRKRIERQADTSQNQCRKPLEEYLQGIRVMKAYNLLGDRFVRLRDAFAELRRACIRQEALLGPFVLLCITLVRAGLTPDGAVRNLPAVGRRTLAARVRIVPRGRLARVRPADFGIDQLCGIPLLLHCRRAYSHADERAGDGRRTAGSSHRRHTVRARVVRLSGQEGAAGRFHHVSEGHADGPRRSFRGAGKSTVMKLCARFYDPQQGACPFRWRSDDGNRTGKSDESYFDGVPGRLSVSGHDTRQYPFRKARCDGRGNHRGGRKPAATISSCACRRDTTRWWAKAVARSPAARSSAYPSPVPY